MTDHERVLLDLLLPETREKYLVYRLILESHGLRECVIVTARSTFDQIKKVQQGRSALKVGWHQLRRAIDRQMWDPQKSAWDDAARRLDLYLQANRIAAAQGFRQIGFHEDGSKRYIGAGTWDPYHIEDRGTWASLAAALEAEAPELAHLA